MAVLSEMRNAGGRKPAGVSDQKADNAESVELRRFKPPLLAHRRAPGRRRCRDGERGADAGRKHGGVRAVRAGLKREIVTGAGARCGMNAVLVGLVVIVQRIGVVAFPDRHAGGGRIEPCESAGGDRQQADKH